MQKNILFEIKRKLVHFLALLFVTIYIIFNEYFGHKSGILFLIFLLIIFLAVDYFRIVKKIKIPIFHIVWREKEKEKLGGNIYFLIGAIIAFAVFDFRIAVTALLMTTFGDIAAALIGIKFGKHLLDDKKTWEGTIAEFLVNLIIGFFLLENIFIIAAMAFSATLVETASTHVDDNLSIPVIAGFVGEVLRLVV